MPARMTQEQFIERMNTKHPTLNFRDASYKNAHTNVIVHCDKHGTFETTPDNLKNSKYGCMKCASELSIQNKDIDSWKEKMKSTMKERYGVEYAQQNSIIREKTLKSYDENYGGHPMRNPSIRMTLGVGNRPISRIQKQIVKLLEDNGLYVECNKKDIIKGETIDIYIPVKKVSIDCKDVWWHTENFLGTDARRYHIDKTEACEEKGIQLIHIWEDDWSNNQKTIENILIYKLGLKCSKINARSCTAYEISSDEYREFLNKLHIQGETESSIRMGLRDNKTLALVSVMGFKKCPSNVNKYGDTEEVYELNRFASEGVRGGFSKLLKGFVKKYQPRLLYSFGDREIVSSINNVYLSNGFFEYERLAPDYKYYDQEKGIRKHKFVYRKNGFKTLGFNIEGKTEKELAEEAGLWKVWDSGKICYIKEFVYN